MDECVDRLLEAVLTLTKERDIPAEFDKKRTMRWLGKLRRKGAGTSEKRGEYPSAEARDKSCADR